ncbi:MAG: sulfatase-like hydrolase/transferase [Chitinophagaceae bacterium]|nr:sulfatase-like hydrolase/transferase [Chitinophagaceae bacterium]
MRALRNIPFFLFLLVLFFCTHGTVENYGYIDAGEVVFVGAVLLFSIAVLFGIIYWFARPNYRLPSLISVFIGLWYLFYGAIYDFIKNVHAPAMLQRYSVQILILLLLTIAWIILLKKRKGLQTRLFLYLNLLLLIYCAIDGVALTGKALRPREKNTTALVIDQSKVRQKPNVYYLLFDEYPGYKSLKDSFGFANDALYDFLHRQQFRVLPVYSNYHFTLFSMSSILNMRYVDPGYDPLKVTQRDFQLRMNEIRNSSVVALFKQMGYRFRNYSIFDMYDQHAVSDQNSFLPVHSVLLTDKILHNRLIRSTGWLMKRFPLWKRKYMFQHEVNNRYSEKMVLQAASEKKSEPVFCYAHFVLPHGPFYRDSTGQYNPDEQIDDELTWTRDAYLGYVKYANSVIRDLVKGLVANDPGAIIVVMSDHGYRTFRNKDPYEPFNYNNICAVRFPDNQFPDFREKWSAVNFFPYLFNAQFGQSIPYQADSSIVLSY